MEEVTASNGGSDSDHPANIDEDSVADVRARGGGRDQGGGEGGRGGHNTRGRGGSNQARKKTVLAHLA